MGKEPFIHRENKANDTPKNNKREEQMDQKLLLRKAMIDSIKDANGPSMIEPTIPVFSTLGCEMAPSFKSLKPGMHICTNLMHITPTVI